MFTSNKKKSGRCISFYACRVFITFYSLNCPQITLRFILGSCFVFKTIFKFPGFDLCKTITIFHGSTHKRAHFLSFIARIHSVKCAFSHAIQQIYLLLYHTYNHIYTFMGKTQICRCFIVFISFFYRKRKRIRSSSSLNDLLSYVHEYFWWGICHSFRIYFKRKMYKVQNKTNNRKNEIVA